MSQTIGLLKVSMLEARMQEEKERIQEEEERTTRIWLIATSIIFGVPSLVCAAPALISSVMMSDTATTGVGLLILSVLSFPVLTLLSIILSWGLYRSKNNVGARYVSLLPLISAFLFIIAWLIMGL
jgi:hypothetical protein